MDLRYTVVVFTRYGTDLVLVTVEVDLTVVTGVGTLRHWQALDTAELANAVR